MNKYTNGRGEDEGTLLDAIDSDGHLCMGLYGLAFQSVPCKGEYLFQERRLRQGILGFKQGVRTRAGIRSRAIQGV